MGNILLPNATLPLMTSTHCKWWSPDCCGFGAPTAEQPRVRLWYVLPYHYYCALGSALLTITMITEEPFQVLPMPQALRGPVLPKGSSYSKRSCRNGRIFKLSMHELSQTSTPSSMDLPTLSFIHILIDLTPLELPAVKHGA